MTHHVSRLFATTRQHKRSSFLRRMILPLGSVAVMAYFGYHSFNGDYGIWSRERMEHEAVGLEKTLAGLKAQHAALASRATLLSPASLDPDMIDERARLNLNVLRSDELVIDLAAMQQKTGQ